VRDQLGLEERGEDRRRRGAKMEVGRVRHQKGREHRRGRQPTAGERVKHCRLGVGSIGVDMNSG
jgi:hypothetical protein